MLVTKDDLQSVIDKLSRPGKRGLDTETTGLSENDKMFSLIVADEDEAYYFNFNVAPDIPDACQLDVTTVMQLLAPIFSHPLNTWYIHNAKFDLRMLAKAGAKIAGRVHCTYAVERIIQNNFLGEEAYRLSGCAARRGLQKDETVEKYISKNKQVTVVTMPGKKKKITLKHFDRVPFSIIVPYGTQDAVLHRHIGLDQEAQLQKLSQGGKYPSLIPLAENEIRLTKTCFAMERRGIRINKEYVGKALAYELGKIEDAKVAFQKDTGEEYKDSNKLFKKIFDAKGEAYPLTEKGNASFAADVLEEMTSPCAALINTIRYHEKRAGTYYSSFLHEADKDDLIHADIRQAGTETGRFSYRNPNLQNIPKEDEGCEELPYLVRGSFIPREGHFFYSIDYNQQEFRMMLDWAGEHALIKAINEGADVHQATADLCGISRRQAKTINFGLLYGMGKAKLARGLGVTEREAHDLICTYFAKLPRVKPLISRIARAGQDRGWIFNWFGRRCHISNSEWAYILPNHFIQGGCADVIKVAMNRIEDHLLYEGRRSSMLIQVHDELLVETPYGEERGVDKIVDIMEKVYKPQNGMRLTCAVEHSFKSWSARDKFKGKAY
jgi:DNA polymerase-1